MAAKILDQRRLRGAFCWCLSGRFFFFSGTRFEIIGSISTGENVMQVNHLVKNTSTGTIKEIPMPALVNILLKCEE